MKTYTIAIVTLFALALLLSTCTRSCRGKKVGTQTESSQTIPLANSYILIMHQDANQPATNRHYVQQSQSNDEVVYKFRESGGLFGKPREGVIRFNPHTLKGSWISTKIGTNDVQGGEILLARKDHGFDIKLTYTRGRSAVVTESYGSLVVHH